MTGHSMTGRSVLDNFGEQLPEFRPGVREQSFTGSGGRPIRLTPPSSDNFVGALQIAVAFELVQDRVERTRSDAVTVAAQLFDHFQPENRFLCGVIKNVQPDEPAVEVFEQWIGHGLQLLSDSDTRERRTRRFPRSVSTERIRRNVSPTESAA
jgi:hypothetical protein